MDLPGGLADAWDKPFVCRLSKAGSAHTEVTHESALTATAEASINYPRGELRGAITSCYGRFFSHFLKKSALLGAHKIYFIALWKSNSRKAGVKPRPSRTTRDITNFSIPVAVHFWNITSQTLQKCPRIRFLDR
ncbi:MAG: hypothetical protein QG621_112 [Patescibacteria group bacterium]|nr:hypothetical protein [Patescibacteria group bacterium]